MKSFLTGSRRYGHPRTDSDVDMVILCDDAIDPIDGELFRALRDNADEIKEYCETSAAFRFGKLNVIVTRCLTQYAAWEAATRECAARAPVTREEAVETMKRHGVV